MKTSLRNLLIAASAILLLPGASAQNIDLPYNSGSSGVDGPFALPNKGAGGFAFGMAYDGERQRVVRFGGWVGGPINETWLWNGTTWAKATPQTSPSGRIGVAMAYDELRKEVILFGGTTGSNTFFSDTWVWNGMVWTQKSPAHSPSVRKAVMAYDAARGEVVLFGGVGSGSGIGLDDTWVWNGNDWTQKSVSGPPARYDHAMAYDGAHQQVVLFGGYLSQTGSRGNDTWVWDGAAWTQKTPSTSPSGRSLTGMCFDAARQQILLYGGSFPFQSDSSETWTWDGTTWTLKSPATNAGERNDFGLVYDAARQKVFLAHGNRSFSNEVLQQQSFTWDGSNWSYAAGPTFTFDLSSKTDAVWHFTTITIPAGYTVNFKRNVANSSVVWLASESVTIDGVINLDGQYTETNLFANPDNHTSPANQGGPGGFDSGIGGTSTTEATKGLGPGGGAPGVGLDTGAHGSDATHVGTYGTAFAIPLIGGSGGGGGARCTSCGGPGFDGGKGGGGGGAILIASSKDIIINGAIYARGGAGWQYQNGSYGWGGSGSGGTIRLVGDRILADGIVDASTINGGNSGRVRLEGFLRRYDPNKVKGNVSASVPSAGSALSQAGARLFITDVAGLNVSLQPKGDMINPDVIFAQSGPVEIHVHAQNIPDTTAVTLKIIHSNGQTYTLPTSGQVTLEACHAIFTETIPAGSGTMQAFATYTIGGTGP